MAVPQAPPYLRRTEVPTETRPQKHTYVDPRTPGPSCVPIHGGLDAWMADTPECSYEQLHKMFEDQASFRGDNFCTIEGCRKRLSLAGPTVLRTLCAHCRFVTRRYSLLWACTSHGRCSGNMHPTADACGACFFCEDCVFTFDGFTRTSEENSQLYPPEPQPEDAGVDPQWLERSERRASERQGAATSSTAHRLPDVPNWDLPRRLDSRVWAENFLSMVASRRG